MEALESPGDVRDLLSGLCCAGDPSHVGLMDPRGLSQAQGFRGPSEPELQAVPRGCVSVLAVPHVKVGSVVPFHQPRPIPCGCLGSFPVDSQGCLGGRSLPTERIFLQKRLSSTLHSPQTRPDPGTCFLPHPGILSDPTSLTLPRFLLKYQTKCIKNRCTSCFSLSCYFKTRC